MTVRGKGQTFLYSLLLPWLLLCIAAPKSQRVKVCGKGMPHSTPSPTPTCPYLPLPTPAYPVPPPQLGGCAMHPEGVPVATALDGSDGASWQLPLPPLSATSLPEPYSPGDNPPVDRLEAAAKMVRAAWAPAPPHDV